MESEINMEISSSGIIAYTCFQIPDYRNAVIVARTPGGVKRATSYAERLRLSIAVIHGEEKVAESERDDGRNSPPPLGVETRKNLMTGAISAGLEFLPGRVPPVILSLMCLAT